MVENIGDGRWENEVEQREVQKALIFDKKADRWLIIDIPRDPDAHDEDEEHLDKDQQEYHSDPESDDLAPQGDLLVAISVDLPSLFDNEKEVRRRHREDIEVHCEPGNCRYQEYHVEWRPKVLLRLV